MVVEIYIVEDEDVLCACVSVCFLCVYIKRKEYINIITVFYNCYAMYTDDAEIHK